MGLRSRPSTLGRPPEHVSMSRDRLYSSVRSPSVRSPRHAAAADGSSSPVSPGLSGSPEVRVRDAPLPHPQEGTSPHRRLGLPRCTAMDAAVRFHVDLTPAAKPLRDDKNVPLRPSPCSEEIGRAHV